MPEPWSTDRDLDIDAVRGAIGDQFPRFALDSVVHLGSGWDYDAYLIDDETVIRFPRRRDVSEGLAREEAILDFVGSALGSSLPVPRITLRGTAGAHFPHRFFGHDHLRGVRADDPRAPTSDGLARELGDALTRIHSISPEAAADAGFGPEEEGCAERLEETERLVLKTDGIAAAAPAPIRWVRAGPTAPAEYAGPARFIHNDLCPDHIIVDEGDGRLVGLIDWSDAALGDPALDFIVLVHWRGWPFVESVLDGYGASLDDGFVERVDFLAKTLGVKWLADAMRRNGDVAKHVGWVRNAFSTGPSRDGR